jgi:hypothetical protein
VQSKSNKVVIQQRCGRFLATTGRFRCLQPKAVRESPIESVDLGAILEGFPGRLGEPGLASSPQVSALLGEKAIMRLRLGTSRTACSNIDGHACAGKPS